MATVEERPFRGRVKSKKKIAGFSLRGRVSHSQSGSSFLYRVRISHAITSPRIYDPNHGAATYLLCHNRCVATLANLSSRGSGAAFDRGSSRVSRSRKILAARVCGDAGPYSFVAHPCDRNFVG